MTITNELKKYVSILEYIEDIENNIPDDDNSEKKESLINLASDFYNEKFSEKKVIEWLNSIDV